MDLFDAIYSRRTIRAYKDKPIEDEKLNKILEAAVQAPSAGNLQSWEFIVVKEKETKEKIVQAALDQNFIAKAPVVVVICANEQRATSKYGERGKTLYSLQDTALAAENLLLAAHALGIGAGWVGAFSEEGLREILNLPNYVRPVAIIPLGYSDEEPTSERFPLEKVIHSEKY